MAAAWAECTNTADSILNRYFQKEIEGISFDSCTIEGSKASAGENLKTAPHAVRLDASWLSRLLVAFHGHERLEAGAADELLGMGHPCQDTPFGTAKCVHGPPSKTNRIRGLLPSPFDTARAAAERLGFWLSKFVVFSDYRFNDLQLRRRGGFRNRESAGQRTKEGFSQAVEHLSFSAMFR